MNQPTKIKCPHTWKDFPWYMTTEYNSCNMTLNIRIFEPYVCMHCKERKDIQLNHITHTNVTSSKKQIEFIDFYLDKYKDYIKPIPVVEDMINDYIYVDREKLDILEKLRNKETPKIEIQNS